jgi:hypothetical protein
MDGMVNKRPRFVPMTLEEALSGKRIPRAVTRSQVLLDVEHIGFDGRSHDGQLVIHRNLKKDVATIFAKLYKWKFPINKIIPAAAYGWSDHLSMDDNNTVAFDYRLIEGTNRLSNHARGAFDINPKQNPHIKNGIVTPHNGIYDPREPGTLVSGGREVSLFKQLGFSWGGDWTSLKDYMHVEKS